jgi:hypothetical protein
MVKPKKPLKNFVGPLPVFDCLFCCGEMHRHFVLFKINENSLNRKYAHKEFSQPELKFGLGNGEIEKETMLWSMTNNNDEMIMPYSPIKHKQ